MFGRGRRQVVEPLRDLGRGVLAVRLGFEHGVGEVVDAREQLRVERADLVQQPRHRARCGY